MPLKLNIIIISTRPGRIGPKIGAWVEDGARRHGTFDAALVDLASFELPVFDEPKHPRTGQYEGAHTKKWSESVRSADAFVFVMPEYNYFPPPSFVNAVDYLSAEWAFKAAGIVSYGGLSGGLRAAQGAKSLLTTVGVMPIPEGVGLPFVHQGINEEGVFSGSEAAEKGLATMLDALHRWAEALKPARG